MIRQQLEQYLSAQDFFQLPSRLSELSAYIRMERNYVNVLQLIDYKSNLYLSSDQYEEIKAAMRDIFREKGFGEVHILTVILAEDIEKGKALAPEDSFCWLIDVNIPSLVVEDTRVQDFYGMRGMLQEFVDTYEERPDEPVPSSYEAEQQKISFWSRINEYIHSMPVVTVILIAANIVVYFLCLSTGNILYSLGETGLTLVGGGQWYRLLTAMFLHADLDHIFSNMLLLYFLGAMLEPKLHRFRFATVYLLSGILGNVISLCYEEISGIPYASFGASGAVYGLIGATLLLVVKYNQVLKISLSQMILLVIYCVYSSFTGQNINAAAHIGGLAAGFLLTLILYSGRKKHED